MAVIDVYSRQGCHLCEILVEELLELVQGRARVDVHDIDSRPDWREAYDVRIPVVELNGEPICQYKLDRDAVNRALAQVADGE